MMKRMREMPLHDRFPVGSEILADINQFVRGNPFISTAALITTLTGITAGIVSVRRRRKVRKSRPVGRRRKKKKSSRRVRRKAGRTRRKRVSHRSPRHKGHKRVSFTTKDGRRVNFLVKKPKHSHRIRRR